MFIEFSDGDILREWIRSAFFRCTDLENRRYSTAIRLIMRFRVYRGMLSKRDAIDAPIKVVPSLKKTRSIFTKKCGNMCDFFTNNYTVTISNSIRSIIFFKMLLFILSRVLKKYLNRENRKKNSYYK